MEGPEDVRGEGTLPLEERRRPPWVEGRPLWLGPRSVGPLASVVATHHLRCHLRCHFLAAAAAARQAFAVAFRCGFPMYI